MSSGNWIRKRVCWTSTFRRDREQKDWWRSISALLFHTFCSLICEFFDSVAPSLVILRMRACLKLSAVKGHFPSTCTSTSTSSFLSLLHELSRCTEAPLRLNSAIFVHRQQRNSRCHAIGFLAAERPINYSEDAGAEVRSATMTAMICPTEGIRAWM